MTIMGGGEKLTQLGSAVAGIMFIWAMFKQYFPPELQGHIEKYTHKLISYVYPFIQITFQEHPGDGFERSTAYAAIERYLSTNSTNRAKRLKANMVRDSRSIILSMDDYEEITDEYKGIKLWWASSKNIPKTQMFSFYGGGEEKEVLQAKIPQEASGNHHQELLESRLEEGLPALRAPGTGKSTMIAAMANLLEYDVYDLELTAVKDNTELRKLLIDTSNKSIIVIEDIDCSLDLTGQRKEEEKDEKKDEEEKDPVKKKMKGDRANKAIRIIVFTTNYVEKLDPALIRRGRMDKHIIELSYCSSEAFKVLARNYLDLDSHELFATIRVLLEETKTSPADVAENLMPKSAEEDADTCLANLIKAIEAAKEEARLKAEEEEKLKAEKEEKEKEKEEKSSEDVEEKKTAVKEVKENGVIT
ncbi:P-loop containing nucleoside triphosphate hydrolases superfamily protein [Actinidia rufa]|uniref:P-loop containing nucleoside triphosphate hydrolases superfamily protein n=1 Tax=Actinidia rufa TaxID=165716 RepID=A0A7J0EKX6_9ERIC|nr:P-loop containing nucleoside triphosphate hydrolases superfamily protein [Actinidia rufa]